MSTYRPELDGLRAIAVGLVLSYHLGVPYGDSGQTGVTVFFVLSGYLITSLLIAERERTGRMDLKRFYLRRARRLLPALVAMLAFVTVAAVVQGRIDSLVGPIIASLLYVADIAKYLLHLPMYELGHTWTLSVEEQFYLVWPVLLIGLLGIGRPVLVLALVAVAAGLAGIDGVPALALGCILAFIPLPTSRWTLPIALAGIALGLAGYAVGALAGSTAAVAYRGTTLASRPLVAVGRVSYGIYLWQYPVLGVLAPPGTSQRPIVAVALTFGLAVLSWQFVERRFLPPRGWPTNFSQATASREPVLSIR